MAPYHPNGPQGATGGSTQIHPHTSTTNDTITAPHDEVQGHQQHERSAHMVMMNWRGTQPIPAIEMELAEHLQTLMPSSAPLGWALHNWRPPGGGSINRAREHLARGDEAGAMDIIRHLAREMARPLFTIVTDDPWSRPTVREWAQAQFEEIGVPVPQDFSPLKRDWYRRQYVPARIPSGVMLAAIQPARWSWVDENGGIIPVHPRIARRIAL